MTLPDDLTELDQWVLWRREHGTKVPYMPNGRKASSTDPTTWSEFARIEEAWRQRPRYWVGPGFVFSPDDPFVGIDLDHCLDESGVVKPWARGIVERFYDCYTEISPSGYGVKIWARGKIPSAVPGVKVGDGQVELYDARRYFCVTGRALNGSPCQIEDHANDVLLLHERLTAGRRGWTHEPQPDGRIPHGRQHYTLVSLAGTLRRRRVCDEAILACLLTVNRLQCQRPGPDENIEQIVRSTRRWGT